jgi:hypothetical protein
MRPIRRKTMMRLNTMLASGLIGVGIFAFSALSASAAIVCSGNVCWHVQERYSYPPSAGVVVHEDEWKAGPDITFREHKGRGYWKGDTWTDFGD